MYNHKLNTHQVTIKMQESAVMLQTPFECVLLYLKHGMLKISTFSKNKIWGETFDQLFHSTKWLCS